MLVGGILVILGVSLASTNYMIDAGVPQKLLSYVSGLVSGEFSFLLLLLFFLLALGAILGQPGRVLDFFVREVVIQGDVRSDGVVEQERLLGRVADGAA